jgi:bzd-type benzoyl-CoA reductase N subunit
MVIDFYEVLTQKGRGLIMSNESISINILQQIRRESPDNKFVKEWKNQGKGVIGWFCTYVPEEIIYAAGFLPYRLTGSSEEIKEADSYLYSNICSFVRSCLEGGVKDQYGFLDGIVSCNTCDAMRRLHDVWSRYLKTSFTRILAIPHKVSSNTLVYYKNQLNTFKTEMEGLIGRRISDTDLQSAIEIYNQSRSLLKELYELRKRDIPLLSGTETLDIVCAGMVMPKPQYNEILSHILTEVQKREVRFNAKARLLISGSIIDQPEYLKAIEDLGGLIVTDDLCTGTRYFWDLVDTESEPLDALARRYLYRTPCARMRPSDLRFTHLMSLIKDFRVTGVIYETIKFCDLYGYDRPMLKKILEQQGIPFLELEREYNVGGLGQIKTRVQAFMEMLGG